MAKIVTERVTLHDSLPAMKLTVRQGLAPVYVRVRKTDARTVRNGQHTDTVLSAQAYLVNEQGAELTPLFVSPEVKTTIHNGNGSVDAALASLSRRALDAMIQVCVAHDAINSIPDILPL